MKRTTSILAAAALGATAGSAGADVTVTGAAEMGIAGSSGDSIRYHTDINANFKMTGETDDGLEFSTAIDLFEVDATDVNATTNDDEHGGIAITLTHKRLKFGNLTLGDTDGALDWVMREVTHDIGGSLRDDHEGHAGFSGNDGLDGRHDGQILRWNNTYGGFSLALSAELDDEFGKSTTGGPHDKYGGDDEAILGIGGRYVANLAGGTQVGIGVGYQTGGDNWDITYKKDNSTAIQTAHTNFDEHAVGMSVDLVFGNGLQTILNYSRMKADGTGYVDPSNPTTSPFYGGTETVTHFGIGLGYKIGTTTIGVNWGSKETDETIDYDFVNPQNALVVNHVDSEGAGLTVTHGLGGGATVQFGYGDSSTEVTLMDAGSTVGLGTVAAGDLKQPMKASGSTWSLGLAFSF